ncbi:type III pantothenate kinase [bacterium]|nr:type III pantothenate kinase [bacterium]MBU1025250.1 type III pantothenate kinase [bacterium]
MLLTIDIGNTNTVIGLFEGDKLITKCRIATDHNATSDQYGSEIIGLLNLRFGETLAPEGIIISSVVPPLTGTFERLCNDFFNLKPLIVSPGIKTGLSIKYDDPRKVGADRIVNAVAGAHLYGVPLILVDFGTAITFCAVNQNMEYLGGAIFPGMRIAYDALFNKAAMLNRFSFNKMNHAIGRSTEESLQSGAVYGYASMVEGMIKKFKKELSKNAKTVLTGGQSEIVRDYISGIDFYDDDLTLKGLRLLYLLNCTENKKKR